MVKEIEDATNLENLHLEYPQMELPFDDESGPSHEHYCLKHAFRWFHNVGFFECPHEYLAPCKDCE
jgi:hypothetical protein